MRVVALVLVGGAAFGMTRALLRRRWELRRTLEIMEEQHRRIMTGEGWEDA